MFLYAYLLMDVWSRKIVGWEINTEESEAHARAFFPSGCGSQQR